MALKGQVSNVYSVGLQNVGSYQVSGQPYLSGSITTADYGSVIWGHFAFPYVSKRIIITNNDTTNKAMVSFAPFLDAEAGDYGFTTGVSGTGNWLLLGSGSSIELDVKCKEIFVSPYDDQAAVNSVTVYAELTNIPTMRMYSFADLEGIN